MLRRGSVMSAMKQWAIKCNMACSIQSLMKRIPVNSINVCKLVFVPDMDIFNICF